MRRSIKGLVLTREEPSIAPECSKRKAALTFHNTTALELPASRAAWYKTHITIDDRVDGWLSTRRSISSRYVLAMARRILNRHELRAEAEAAEALGLNTPPIRKPRSDAPPLRPKPGTSPRMRVVWAVCDVGGRTVATFEYPRKDEADALAADLKAKRKGTHFVRSIKVPIDGD